MFETWLRSDLKKPLTVECLEGTFFSGDNEGNLVGVEVFDDGSPASLSGGVTGYVIRADDVTVTISGTLSDNKASIVLPASAYTVPGFASIVIKVSTVTVGACVVYVYRSTTDSYFDPGHVVPSLEELLAKIADCEAATAAAMEVANLTVSAETASGTTPTATLTDEGVGDQTHKHITFGLVRGERGYTGVTPYFTIGTVERGEEAAATITGTAEYPVLNLTLPKGDVGATGATPDISIGNVETGAEGSSASATITGTAEYPVLSFTIPRGNTGATGATGAVPDITVGNVTTLQPGQNATVTRRSGSPDTAPVFDFGIPKGDPGQAGDVYGNTIAMSSTDSTLVSEAIDEKLDAPATAGTSGQVLTSDGQGGASWQNSSVTPSVIVDLIYPVGSIYMSVSSTSPATLFGGTWAQIQDTFLLSAGSTYTAGDTGGSATHTLTTAEMPSHNHAFTGSEVTSGAQSADHTHTYTDYYATTTGNHALTTAQLANHAHDFTYNSATIAAESSKQLSSLSGYYGSGSDRLWKIGTGVQGAGSGNNHNHSGANTSASRTSDGVSANHTHTVTASGSIGNTGNGTAFSTLPPYLAVYVWKRTA